ECDLVEIHDRLRHGLHLICWLSRSDRLTLPQVTKRSWQEGMRATDQATFFLAHASTSSDKSAPSRSAAALASGGEGSSGGKWVARLDSRHCHAGRSPLVNRDTPHSCSAPGS